MSCLVNTTEGNHSYGIVYMLVQYQMGVDIGGGGGLWKLKPPLRPQILRFHIFIGNNNIVDLYQILAFVSLKSIKL